MPFQSFVSFSLFFIFRKFLGSREFSPKCFLRFLVFQTLVSYIKVVSYKKKYVYQPPEGVYLLNINHLLTLPSHNVSCCTKIKIQPVTKHYIFKTFKIVIIRYTYLKQDYIINERKNRNKIMKTRTQN